MIIALIALPAVAVMLAILARMELSLTTAPRPRPEPVQPAAGPVAAEIEPAPAA